MIDPCSYPETTTTKKHDLCDTGAVLYQLSYQANWELVTLRVWSNQLGKIILTDGQIARCPALMKPLNITFLLCSMSFSDEKADYVIHLSNRTCIHNKILNHDLFSAPLFVTQLTCDYVVVQLKLCN